MRKWNNFGKLCNDLTISLDTMYNLYILINNNIRCSEQCHNLISGIYKTSCKTGEGIQEMFEDIAQHLVEANRSRMELHEMDKDRFKISYIDEATDPSCLC